MPSRAILLTAVMAGLAVCLLGGSTRAAVDLALEGADPEPAGRVIPGVEAAFELESYRPGERASLTVAVPSGGLTIQLFRSGPERVRTLTDMEMNGIRVTRPRHVGGAPGKRTLAIAIGGWPSGLYFAKLQAKDGRIGFAPFVVSPRRIGVHRVAVVLPTLTWQAYNFRDDDGDGTADSWYAQRRIDSVRLGRPHLDRGVPYGFRYHLGFLNWLSWTGRRVDYLSQLELEQASGPDALARAYDLIVFAGHHEYVTEREYDLIQEYRDRGGNLLFLSANNFFWRVERSDDVIVRTHRWRDVGRPEAGLVGVQYIGYQRTPRAGWVVRPSPSRSWLFAGTGLRLRSRFSRGGVEIDQANAASPAGIQIVAEIPHLFGPGRSAQMSYYETPAGAKVLAAGAFHLTRAVTSDPVVWRFLENVWMKLTRP